jgi:ABC-type transporter Mla subunit MlaD
LDSLTSIGLHVRKFVLDIADLLRDEASPGLVSLALIIALIVAVGIFLIKVQARKRALLRLDREVSKYKGGSEFSRNISQIDNAIREQGRRGPAHSVAEHWDEFRETLVLHEESGEIILRNAARPSVFFNVEDLGFGAGFWRIVPGLFVTVGLFLTFLGLVSALQAMSGKIDADGLNTLLTVASAKFIMSLTGLFCSIIFTIVLRYGMSQLEKAAHDVSSSLERRLSFISLEYLALEQLSATREQREHFRTIGMELVAELGRPLREDLPRAISASIQDAMRPVLDQVRTAGTQGIGSMVQDLSSRFSDDVGNALRLASEKLANAGDRIGLLSERMDQSSGRMGGEMDAAVTRVAQAVDELRKAMTDTAGVTGGAFTQGAERMMTIMNETLEGIRQNTGEGAKAMSAASHDLRQAGETFRQQLEGASRLGGETAQKRIEASGEEIARLTREVTENASKRLLSPLESIAQQLGVVVSQAEGTSSNMRSFSEGVRAGAEASLEAAGNFRSASQELVNAATPVRANSEQIERSIRNLSESTDNIARSAHATVASARDALDAATAILGEKARAVEFSLTGLAALVEQFRGQGDRLDDMDEKLGNAFETYRDQVDRAVAGMQDHMKNLNRELAPALDTLRVVVDRAEQFMPQSRL